MGWVNLLRAEVFVVVAVVVALNDLTRPRTKIVCQGATAVGGAQGSLFGRVSPRKIVLVIL